MQNSRQRLLILREKTTLAEFQSFKEKKLIRRVRVVLFPYITCGILVFFLFGVFFGRASQTLQIVRDSNEEWIETIVRMYDVAETGRNAAWDTLESEIITALKPVTSLTGMQNRVNSDVATVLDHLRDWQEITEPLTQYIVTNEGFVHISQERYFTDDLEIFLQEAELLFRQSKRIWNNFWYYRYLAYLSGNSQIINLLGLAQTAFETINDLLAQKTLILEQLGHFGRRRMLVISQNIGEARPTGGFTGSYLPIDVIKGQIEIGQSQSIYFISNTHPKQLLSHPANNYYFPTSSDPLSPITQVDHGLHNQNYLPCFPDTARSIHQAFATAGEKGFTSDVVILVSSLFLEDILPPNYSFPVEGYGTFNSNNLLQEIERITSIEAQSVENPKSAFTPIIQSLLQRLPSIVQTTGLRTFLESFIRAITARDLQIWFNQQDMQQIVSRFGLNGDTTCQNLQLLPVITPVIANISSDKRNLITKNEFNMYTQRVFGGHRITITFTQRLPENPALQRGFNRFRNQTFVGMQIPSDAYDFEIQSRDIVYSPTRYQFFDASLQKNANNLTFLEGYQTLYNTLSETSGGYMYKQPDGSQVIGTMIADTPPKAQVTFTFTLPIRSQSKLMFASQPGLMKPSLGLGRGIVFSEKPEQRLLENRLTLQEGVLLSIS